MDWKAMFVIFGAIVAASMFEHMVLAPRMAHSPGKTLPSNTAVARTAADFVAVNFPNAVSVS